MPKHLIHGQNGLITLVINKIMSQGTSQSPISL